ncbi:MAG: helix-turn-helix domain-containing protein, partial [Moraxellaceae bacterium]
SISAYDLRLADIVLGGFFICWLWSFVAYFLGAYISQEINHWLGVLNNYLNVILINTLFIFGFSNTRQLLTVHVEATPNIDKVIELPKLRGKIAAIENGIHNQKLYLESNINLERFSERIGLRAREVSTVLNAHYQSNFFEFINGYRITEAKRILVEEDATVLDVLYRCGFNSQSAFHRFFKRLTGVTPSEYRQQQASENQK